MKINKYENNYQKDYRIGERQLVNVNINKPSACFPEFAVKINWSCIGSVNIEEAECFSKELRKAISIAKRERKNNDKTE